MQPGQPRHLEDEVFTTEREIRGYKTSTRLMFFFAAFAKIKATPQFLGYM